MNLCFLYGKIVSNNDFKFMINSKNISKAVFYLKLKNDSIIKIKAYNEIADFCFSKLKKGNSIILEGTIDSRYDVTVREIQEL